MKRSHRLRNAQTVNGMLAEHCDWVGRARAIAACGILVGRRGTLGPWIPLLWKLARSKDWPDTRQRLKLLVLGRVGQITCAVCDITVEPEEGLPRDLAQACVWRASGAPARIRSRVGWMVKIGLEPVEVGA